MEMHRKSTQQGWDHMKVALRRLCNCGWRTLHCCTSPYWEGGPFIPQQPLMFTRPQNSALSLPHAEHKHSREVLKTSGVSNKWANLHCAGIRKHSGDILIPTSAKYNPIPPQFQFYECLLTSVYWWVELLECLLLFFWSLHPNHGVGHSGQSNALFGFPWAPKLKSCVHICWTCCDFFSGLHIFF